MASRIIHLAIAKGLTQTHPDLDTERFYLGSVLPDACRDKSAHYSIFVADGSKKTHDLTFFRRQYGRLLDRDPLYLGFYLHLIQDILFRNVMYGELRFDSRPAGNVERLHLDYKLTNRYVIQRYGLEPISAVPAELWAEPLLQAHPFLLGAFLEELRQDFLDCPAGTTVFFTETIADQVIARCLEACRRELEAVRRGEGYFDEVRFAWRRHETNTQEGGPCPPSAIHGDLS